MLAIDLSLPLDQHTRIFSQGHYTDPPLEIAPWADIARNGYAVQAVRLGTQTGTHLDMPAHFYASGRTTAQLDPQTLVGPAVVVDLSSHAHVTDLSPWRTKIAAQSGIILLVRARANGTQLSAEALKELVTWHPQLTVIAGELRADGPGYPVLAALLGADIPVVEEVDSAQAARVQNGDLLVIAPLPLRGTSGAPCRVLAIRV